MNASKRPRCSGSHGSGSTGLRENSTQKNDDKSEDVPNKFSSSSFSSISAMSAKYKSLEKKFTPFQPKDDSLTQDDLPPPLPRSAVPPLNRQNAEKLTDASESDAINSEDQLASSASGNEKKSIQTSNVGGGTSSSGTDSMVSTRQSRIDTNVAALASQPRDEDDDSEKKEVEQPQGAGRCSRSDSNCNLNEIAANSIAPYVPPMLATRGDLQPYATYQRYGTHAQIQTPAVYAVNEGRNKSAPCKMQMFRFLEVAMKRILFHLAKAATEFQFIFQVLPLFLTLLPLFALWYIRADLKLDTPPFESFQPDPYVDSGQQFDAHLYKKYFSAASAVAPITAATVNALSFNGSNPMFDAPRRTSPYEFSVILSTKDPRGNILNNSSLAAYRRLFAQIRNISVTHSLIRVEWTDLCREECADEDRKLITAIQSRQLLLKYPEAVVLKTFDGTAATAGDKSVASSLFHNVNRVFLANIVGDVELDLDGVIARARSLLLNLKLKESTKPQTLIAFEHSLRQVLANFSSTGSGEELDLYAWSFRAYVDEVMRAAKGTHVKLIFCLAMFAVVLFVVLGFCHRNAYKCHPFVALQIAFVSVFAVFLSYAVHILAAGGQMNYAIYPAAFVLCALAALLFGAISQCFSRYSLAALHPIEKLAFIYSWDMPAFVGTLLSLAIACAGCAWTAESALIRQLLLLLTTGLVSLLLFGVFYLTVFWYTAEYCEASGLKWFQICKKGDESFNDKYVFDYDELICDRLHERLADLRPSGARWFGRLAARNHFRTLGAVAYTAFLIFAGVGLFAGESRRVQMREDFFVANVTAADSSAAFLHRFDAAYEKYVDYVEIVFELPVDYYSKRNKERIFDLLRWPLDTQYATRAISWLTDFESFQKSTIFDVNSETIVPVVNYVFLKSDPYRKYATDIVFDRFQTQILRSRMYLELSAKGVASSNILIKELERRAKEAGLPVVFNTPYAFLLRHDRHAFNVSLAAFGWLAAFLTLACFVLFTHAVVWLSVPVASLLAAIGAGGLLQMIGVPFNIVTMSTILIGNWYTAAVMICFCYAFNNAGRTQDTNAKRMKYAYQCTLCPTLLSGVLPLLCYAPLLFGDAASPNVWHVFKALAAVSLFTLLNYFCLLPSLTVILTDYIAVCATSLNNFCNAQTCCVVDASAESVYVVSSRGDASGLQALTGGCGTRSIASFYNTPNYIMNEARMLPPSYDYRQRMITAGDAPTPPPLPPLPPHSATNSASRRPLCDQLNGVERSTGKNVLSAEQLSSSYPNNAYRSPTRAQRQRRQTPNVRHTTLDSGASASPYLSNCGAITQKSSDNNSNCDSIDSRQAPVAGKHNKGNAGYSIFGLQRDFPTKTSPANSPHVNNSRRRGRAFNSSRSMTRDSEQIYEEPESPVILRTRRSHSDGRRQNAVFDVSTKAGDGAASSFSPQVLRREIADQMAGGAMHANWRHCLLNNNMAATGDGTPTSRSATIAMPLSPSTNRCRYRF